MVVDDLSPAFLLDHPEIVTPAAPWCCWLTNLELAILLLTQPWLSEEGLSRADLERQLGRLGVGMPVGAIYFQRVNRAAAALVAREQLVGRGTGRTRRFVLTPAGFAAMLLNLQVVRGDPTVDGRRFEFKRALVSMANVVLDRLLELPPEGSLGPSLDEWFDAVDALTVWGRPVMNDAVYADAFSVLRLVERQQERVRQLERLAEARLAGAATPAALARQARLAQAGGAIGAPDADLTAILQTARSLAAAGLPQLSARADLVRYRAYQGYLTELTTLYASELRVVDMGLFRRVMTGRTG
ncbi:MAG: hypothetical protein QF681_00425 [Vicinamibacterales bacterium]|nr:hypothetical protein [Vicinamibacterales bacterium]